MSFGLWAVLGGFLVFLLAAMVGPAWGQYYYVVNVDGTTNSSGDYNELGDQTGYDPNLYTQLADQTFVGGGVTELGAGTNSSNKELCKNNLVKLKTTLNMLFKCHF
jgi:hypothetical protein